MSATLAHTRVVDPSGLPLRVYHGTTATFERFSGDYVNPGSQYGAGYYFTEHPFGAGEWACGGDTFTTEAIEAGSLEEARAMAEEDAKARGLRLGMVVPWGAPAWWLGLLIPEDTAPNVRPAYLDIRNPLDVDAPLSEEAESAIEAELGSSLPRLRGSADAFVRVCAALGLAFGLGQDTHAATLTLEACGYDGITHRWGFLSDRPEDDCTQRVWIAFRASQILPWPN